MVSFSGLQFHDRAPVYQQIAEHLKRQILLGVVQDGEAMPSRRELAAQTGIAGSTKIGKHCILGGQVGIAGHLTVADNTTFGAQTGLISSVKKEGQVLFGSPALPHKDFLRSYAVFRKNGRQ